jgi:hypothetical protein
LSPADVPSEHRRRRADPCLFFVAPLDDQQPLILRRLPGLEGERAARLGVDDEQHQLAPEVDGQGVMHQARGRDEPAPRHFVAERADDERCPVDPFASRRQPVERCRVDGAREPHR